ncbi:hypothetical protein ACFC4S_24525 [Priestia megaterium]|uniref:hypothetical protein n=1 Tax=Priestia megaterium TaxID=1404 RepID=UPI0035DBF763
MSYNVKELQNLSKDEQIEFLMKTLESVSCSNQDCSNDKPDGKWGVIENKKYCNVCYSRELRKEEIRLKRRQEELHKLVEYYEFYLKAVDAIENLKIELNVSKEEFKILTDPLKLAFKEAKKVQDNNKKSLNPNRNKQPQQQQNKSQQPQAELTRNTSTPNKQAKPYTEQPTDEITSNKRPKSQVQQRKKVTAPVIENEEKKQEEIQEQPSPQGEAKKNIKPVLKPNQEPLKESANKQKEEGQVTNTQFVTQVNSETVYGENPAESAPNTAIEDEHSLFNLDPGCDVESKQEEYNENYALIDNSNSTQDKVTNIRVPLTSVSGIDL